MTNFEWSAIVYARTYEVDFRFIAIPQGYTNDDIADIESYVLVSTRLAEKLPSQPRWSLYRNARQCVFGVTCMANELVDAAKSTDIDISNWATMTRDNCSCPLFLFVGYVCNDGKAIAPAFDQLQLSLFTPLYQYVVEQWFVKPYQESSRIAIRLPYTLQKWNIKGNSELNPKPLEPLINFKETGKIFFIPDDEKILKADIWNTIAKQPIEASLCFGLSRERDVLDSPLLIASLPINKEMIKEKTPVISHLQATQSTVQDDRETEQCRENPLSQNCIEEKKINDQDVIEYVKEVFQKTIESGKEAASKMLEKILNVSPRKENKQNDQPSELLKSQFVKKSSEQTDLPKKGKSTQLWDLD
ncbi:MAG: hypothetical protein WCJ03_07140 [Bacteroidales bacterium]